MKAGARLARDWQELAVSPEILGPLRDLFACQPDCRVVVHGLEGTQAPVTDVEGVRGELCLADVALQSNERAHTASASMQCGSLPGFRVADSTFRVLGAGSDQRPQNPEPGTLNPEPVKSTTPSPRSMPLMSAGADTGGAGTIAARSRAIVKISPIAATAVGAPPAPTPTIPTSPACSPLITAAFSGPTVRAKTDDKGTMAGATQAVSAARPRSYCA